MFTQTIIGLSLLATWSPSQNPKPQRDHGHVSQPADDAQESDTKKPDVYDEQALGHEQISAALVKAKRNHRRVLIQWGANWCGWCLLLDKTFQENAEVRQELLYEYDLIHIDIGRFDKHMDLVAGYGLKLKGVPHLTILDEDGKVVAQVDTTPLEEKNSDGTNGHSAERVLAMLKEHRAPRVQAKALLTDAIQAARTQKKRVFLIFGAPW